MNPRKQRRVAITGIGVISPLGLTADATWAGIKSGRSGVGPITRFDASGHETTFAAEVKNFDPVPALGRKESRRMDRFAQLGVSAAIQAAESARLASATYDPTRVGVILATGLGAIETIENGMETLTIEGPRRVGPFFMTMMLANMASGVAAIMLNAKGPNVCTVSACASSAHALGEGMRWIRDGLADVVIAGGCEAPVTRLSVAGFNSMGALSRRNDAPMLASRPFDAQRDGFVVAEGAAVLTLEAWDSAVSRGATILAELLGYGTTDDANHVVQPAPDGDGASRAMAIALADAEITAEQIDYVNAHGTSTVMNEKYETMALKSALGKHALRVPISSTKSMTGHLLGAAGSLEAAICVQAILDECIPPTINQEFPDPECDLDYVPNVARAGQLRYVLTNSNGFGGHNVSLVIAKADVRQF